MIKANGPSRVLVKSVGAGRFVWSPLPLEASNSMDPLVAFYRFALAQTHVSAGIRSYARHSVTPGTPVNFREACALYFRLRIGSRTVADASASGDQDAAVGDSPGRESSVPLTGPGHRKVDRLDRAEGQASNQRTGLKIRVSAPGLFRLTTG